MANNYVKENFTEATQEQYGNFLEYLGDYRYMPNTMADRTEIYFLDDKKHEYMVATRYLPMYDDPETYWIRNGLYELYGRILNL